MAKTSEILLQYLEQRKKRGDRFIRFSSVSDFPKITSNPSFMKKENSEKTHHEHLSENDKNTKLEHLKSIALVCQKCPHLVRSRTQVVFGVGNIDAELMLVGEAPGADEDRLGEPFVGRAGQLLNKMLEAMGLSRDKVYISNVLKCRPDMPPGAPGNRKPTIEEMNTCLPYLKEQIELIQPKAIIALGATAVTGLLGVEAPIGKLRGRWLQFQDIAVMPTYHPAYLLRNQSNTEKRKVWEDLLMVMEKMEMLISEKQRNYFLNANR
ncbi:MAG: uracil-DNA glycosylase [Verrucomicrobiia bacterium]